MRYRFGEFELDAESCALTRAGVSLRVWPKVFDVLRYLVEHHERMVSKQELLEQCWSDSHVDEVAVPWTISHARRALGQRSGEKSPIETVHGRGYRFVASVERLTEPAPDPTPEITREAAPADFPFVGRDEVMQRLDARLLEAKQGMGGLCALVGPAGIGKTRCMDELATRARAAGFSVWAGRSVEDAWAPVFWPWVQIVRAAVQERSALAERGRALLAHLGVLQKAVVDTDEPQQAQDDNFWWINGVSRLLLDAASERPIVILLDDLHWADAATIDLLGFLAPDLRHVPVLAIATQRGGHAAFHARQLKRLARNTERIELGPLTEDDVAQYIRQLVHASAPSAELYTAVHRASAGNPLFLQQTMRTLAAKHGARALASLSPSVVEPPTVARDVLHAALQVLQADTRELLALASVLGETFDVSTLQQLCGLPIEELLGSLESARHEGFLIAEEPIAYRFCHALLRSILYDDLPAGQRMLQHRRAAEILERQPALARHGEVAHHHYKSLALGDHARVTHAATHAARAAARLQAFADAAMFCEWACAAQALEHDVQPRARAELLLFSAQMQANAGQDELARQTVTSLIAIARPHGYFDLLVRAARTLRPWHLMGAIEDPLVLTILEEALQGAPEGPNDLRISALSQLSWLPPYAFDIRRSKELSGRALDLAHAQDDDNVLLRALHARLYALSGPEDVDALLAVVHEMLTRERAPNGWASAGAYGARYGAQLYRGDMAGADATWSEFGTLTRLRQWPSAVWYHDRVAVQRSFLNGDFAGATRALPELLERGQRLRLPYARSLVDIQRALLVLEQQGLSAFASGTDLTLLRAGWSSAPIGLRPCIARVLVELGEHAPGIALLDSLAADGFASVPKEINYLNALANLSIIAIELADRARAERLYELLAPFPHHNTPNVLLYYEGSVSHFLALLCVFLKREDAAEAHFDDALAMNEKLGQRPQLARTAYEYARWLAARAPRISRKNSARDLQSRSLELARAMGMTSLVTRLVRLPLR